ncbi:putative signal transducing protein [Fulvivirga ligni]|uniref:putative signal transducing protein n=1 Tax=Fulvivirga ligni TaxID=2904246 RepID=UPI001F1D91D2|nr:DUF2007 domain-containing protein [Fulvivirga ligni]UII19635.1 DUF2007 domain-containing protein [Fulvivirga ligni]
MKLVVLTTLDNSIDANLLRSKLESEGIPCFLHNENVTNLIPYSFNILGGGVRVLVPDDQLEASRELAQLNEEKIHCPNCGSDNIKNRLEKWWIKLYLIFIGFFLVAPIGNLLNHYICRRCGEEFKK